MVFTQEDAKNDGKIKDEAGTSMKQIAARESSELYTYYTQVCENMGVDPGTDLADMAVRALESQEFSERVLNTQVDLRKIKENEIRTEDMKQVKQLYEEFSGDGGSSIDIESIIEQRLQQKASGPLGGRRPGGLGGGDGEGGSSNREVEMLKQEVRELKQELAQKEQSNENNAGRSSGSGVSSDGATSEQAARTGDVSATTEDDVDSLFDENNEEDEEAEVTEVNIDAGGNEVYSDEFRPDSDSDDTHSEAGESHNDDGERGQEKVSNAYDTGGGGVDSGGSNDSDGASETVEEGDEDSSLSEEEIEQEFDAEVDGEDDFGTEGDTDE